MGCPYQEGYPGGGRVLRVFPTRLSSSSRNSILRMRPVPWVLEGAQAAGLGQPPLLLAAAMSLSTSSSLPRTAFSSSRVSLPRFAHAMPAAYCWMPLRSMNLGEVGRFLQQDVGDCSASRVCERCLGCLLCLESEQKQTKSARLRSVGSEISTAAAQSFSAAAPGWLPLECLRNEGEQLQSD